MCLSAVQYVCVLVFAAFSLGLYDRIRGSYLDHPRCKIEWNHNDNDTVGGSTVIAVQVRNEKEKQLFLSF